MTKKQIYAASPETVLGMITAWLTSAKAMVERAGTYWRMMQNPGGQPWLGDTADAAKAMAGNDRTAIEDVGESIETMATTAGNAINDTVIPNLNDVKAKIEAAEAAGFTVNDDLTVSGYSNTSSSGGVQIVTIDPKRKEDAERRQGEIIQAAEKWWNSDQAVADQINNDKKGLSAKFNSRAVPPADSSAGSNVDRTQNQIDAFRQMFGRVPTSPNDWKTAAVLDPHSYNDKNGGVAPSIVVGRINPVPGQGLVRTNLFIPGESAWTPSGANLGDNRGFSSTAGPEDSRVTIYVDYDNGIVVARQNPSVMGGQVKAGSPDIQVSQNPSGSVMIGYHAADPFSPGGESLAKETPWNVNGQIVIKPTAGGPIMGGSVSDFPAIESYNDHGSTTTTITTIMPQNTSAFGPLAGLPFSQEIGSGLMTEFPDTVYAPPAGLPVTTGSWLPGAQIGGLSPAVSGPPVMQPAPPIIIPYPAVSLGPASNPVQVPVGH